MFHLPPPENVGEAMVNGEVGRRTKERPPACEQEVLRQDLM